MPDVKPHPNHPKTDANIANDHPPVLDKEDNEIKHLKQQLDEKNKEISILKQILDSVPGSIYWKDLSGVYMGRNRHSLASCIEIGIEEPDSTIDNIIGKNDFDMLPKEIAQQYRNNDIKIITSGETQQLEESVYDKDGSEVIQLSAKSPLYNDKSQIKGVVGVTLNISDLKQVQRILQESKDAAEASNLTKMQFIRNMEHDIRTPMTGIIGLTSILEKIDDKAKYDELLKDIKLSAERLLEHCDVILQFLQIDEQQTPIQYKVCDVNEICQKILEMFSATFNSGNVNLKTEIDNIKAIKIDSHRFQSILINLLSNAIKFTPSGTISLSCKVADCGKNIIVKVSDTGIGINKADHTRIFESFARVSESNQGKFNGFGLGLSIIKQFVDDLNGEVQLESELGKGSTFTIVLPIE